MTNSRKSSSASNYPHMETEVFRNALEDMEEISSSR